MKQSPGAVLKASTILDNLRELADRISAAEEHLRLMRAERDEILVELAPIVQPSVLSAAARISPQMIRRIAPVRMPKNEG